jgi:multidrug efflux pump subunit AcrB
VGSLVDNAIVCMENVTRHREELGKDHATAAIEGTEEVVMPMFSSAITNVAVFMPLMFVQGAAQKLFRDLFIANTLATMGSYFIAITLIPQLISHPVPLAPLQKPPPSVFSQRKRCPTPVRWRGDRLRAGHAVPAVIFPTAFRIKITTD